MPGPKRDLKCDSIAAFAICEPREPMVKLLNGPRSREIKLLEPIRFSMPMAREELMRLAVALETVELKSDLFLDGEQALTIARRRFPLRPELYEWEVPAGYISNGASVPRFFWRLWPPLTGPWRVPAIIHDYHCEAKIHDSVAVHAMFYHAMRAYGTSETSSHALWAAVRAFGPRFEALRSA